MESKIDTLIYLNKDLRGLASDYSKRTNLDSFHYYEGTFVKNDFLEYCLNITSKSLIFILKNDGLYLKLLKPNIYEFKVDFLSSSLNYRRKFGGGKNQMLAKAFNLRKNKSQRILDTTAGLGTDAFILSCLGSNVNMLERNPNVSLILENAIYRAKIASKDDMKLSEIISRMSFSNIDAISYIKSNNLDEYDAIYLDPMFPYPEKRSLSKKNMQLMQNLVGEDIDYTDLLKESLGSSVSRVVLKRPKNADTIMDFKPNLILKGKSNRFDIFYNF